MKKLFLIIITCLFCSASWAQKVSLTLQDVSLSEALKRIDKKQNAKRIHFVYNELEDFRVTKDFRNFSVIDAIYEVCGFYPISVTVADDDIFVECMDKESGRFIGQVVDEKGKPVMYANVQLLNPKDSSFVTGGVCNETGRFVIPCQLKHVMARISCVGMKTLQRMYTVGDVGRIVLKVENMQLKEVVVEQKEMMQKDGKLMYFLSKNQKNNAYDAYSALSLMMLPGIDVDVTNQQITKYAGVPGLLVCINNRPVENDELITLNPKDIERVDYYVNYNPEHPDAGSVIDFIMKVRDNGGIVMARASEKLDILSGQDIVDWKKHHGRSEYNVQILGDYTHYRPSQDMEETTTMSFPQGEIVKQSAALPSLKDGKTMGGKLSYLRYIGKKDMLKLAAYVRTNRSKEETKSMESFSMDNCAKTATDNSRTGFLISSFSGYLQKTFADNLQLRLSMKGSYNHTNNNRDYRSFSNILSNTKEDMYSLNPSLTLRYTIGRHTPRLLTTYFFDKSDISYLENGLTANSGLTAGQWILDLLDAIKLSDNVTLQLDLQERVFTTKSNGVSNTESYFTPKAYLDMNLPKNNSLNLGIYLGVFNPNPEFYDITVKSIDKYQILIGNPHLDIRRVLSSYLSYTKSHKWGVRQFYAQYQNTSKCIYETVRYDEERNAMLHTYLNGGTRENLNLVLSEDLNLIPKTLKFTAALQYDYAIERDSPTIIVRDLLYTFMLSYTAKKFNASASLKSGREGINSGTRFSLASELRLGCGYNHKNWNFSCFTRNPFMKGSGQSELFIANGYRKERTLYFPHVTHNVFNLTAVYRLSYGKQHKFNEVDVDTSVKSAILRQ